MKDIICYRSKDLGCCAPADGFSAYCTAHQPEPAFWHADLKGRKQCQCAACGEVFTTVRTFDSHQRLINGKVACSDPRKMRDGNKRRKLVLTTRGWGKNPDLEGFDTFRGAG